MTPERFLALLDACGSDLRRWPDAEQDAAHRLAAMNLPELRAAQARAAALDGWLGDHAVAAPGEALQQRILALAPVGQVPSRATWKPAPGWHWLWPGAGLAGAGLAGTLAGALAVSVALSSAPRPLGPDGPERITAFSAPLADWSEE
ncbi:MAG: hypothetical protein AB7I35_02580 [Ramlibacter sp.]